MHTFAEKQRNVSRRNGAQPAPSGRSPFPGFGPPSAVVQTNVQARADACACGGGCPTCRAPHASPTLQRAGAGVHAGESRARIHANARHGTSGAGGTLPHAERIQASFGRHDVSHIVAHSDAAAAASAARSIGASAFTIGRHVAFADEPSVHTAAHEAAHAIQQQHGVDMPGGVGRAGDRYEQHADAVADRVVAGESSEDLLGRGPAETHGGAGLAVQRDEVPQTAEEKRKGDIQAQYRKELGSFLGDGLGGIIADTLAPGKLAGYLDKGLDALTTLSKDALKDDKTLSPSDSATAQDQVGEMGAWLRAKAAEFLKTEEGKKFIATVSKYASKPALVLPAAILVVQAAMVAILYAYKKIDFPNIPIPIPLGDLFTVTLGLDLGQAKVFDVQAARVGLAYEKKDEAKGTNTKVELTGEYKPPVDATQAPDQVAFGAGFEDKRLLWGGKLEQKFGTKLTFTDWKPYELEAAYHIGLAFETKNYAPPQIAMLQGSGGWTRTVSLFSDVLSKTRFEGGDFSAEDLNVRLGMSYVLNRKPTVTRTRDDGTTYVEKVNPVNFSIAPYLGLGARVGPPITPQTAPGAIAPAATATQAGMPKDEGKLKLSPNVGFKLRIDF